MRLIKAIAVMIALSLPALISAAEYTETDVTSGSSITGVVHWDGELPQPFSFEVNRDKVLCGTNGHLEQSLISISSRELVVQGACVYLEDIRAGVPFTSQTLDLQYSLDFANCLISPRMLVMPENGALDLYQREDLVHRPQITGENFNWSEDLVTTGTHRRVHLRKPGDYIVRCARHPWEYARVIVANHPYFTFSDAAGQFTLSNIPPGGYTVVVRHPSIAPVPVTRNGVVVDYDFSNELTQQLRVLLRRDQTLETEFVLPAGGGKHLR